MSSSVIEQSSRKSTWRGVTLEFLLYFHVFLGGSLSTQALKQGRFFVPWATVAEAMAW